ncbi:MAG TPA: HAMP domain-containing sensor histidine kinase [Gaiella sp.]|uniref:sensor histidine kinase n=1 Tax=Gaiella sp. TaxID=2663207 RepID=UPI002D8100D8|nr:HAMP domain-containing sensor histidine kinase [Gaiella sp.]HET9286869.1 HAMP domain-containing sensor histidine kinase [Gaiella sp.]
MTGADRVSGESSGLALLAHELRSPVAALVALAEAAPTVPPSGRRRLVGLAAAAASDIERLLTDSELLSLRIELVDLGLLVSALATDTVVVSVEGRPTARADPTRLRQAIANLVANGLRHGAHVAIAVVERDARVVVDVEDDGPGVDPTLDPFELGVSGAGSSGVGLWLARGIAEAHGGSLVLVPGPRARFRLALPSASGAP